MMRKLLFVAIALHLGAAVGSVWDGCLGWYCGMNDANGNGKFDAGEFRNVLAGGNAGDATHNSTVRYGSSSAGALLLETQDVALPYNGRVLPNQRCVRFPKLEGDNGQGKTIATYPQYLDLPIRVTTNTYSAFIRFKPDQNWTVLNGTTLRWVFNVGSAWGDYRGIMFGLYCATNDYRINCSFGKGQVNSADLITNSATGRREQWYDVVMLVSNNVCRLAVAAPALARKEGAIKWATVTSPYVTNNVPSTYVRIGNEGTGNTTPYMGLIHSAAVWNRYLSDDEVKEVMSTGTPEVWGVGLEQADGNKTFGGASGAVLGTTVQDWAKFPSVFASGATASVSYMLDNYHTNLAQVLRAGFASDSATGTIEVSVDNVKVGTLSAAPGAVCRLYLPRTLALGGNHVCTLTRTDNGTGNVKFNFVKAGGSAWLGLYDGEVVDDTSNENEGVQDYYLSDSLRRLRWAIADSTNNVDSTGHSASSYRKICIHVNMPDDLIAEGNTYVLKSRMLTGGTNGGTKFDLVLRLNGTELGRWNIPGPLQFDTKIPRSLFNVGDNVLQYAIENLVVTDPKKHNTWLTFDGHALEITDYRHGLCVIFK